VETTAPAAATVATTIASLNLCIRDLLSAETRLGRGVPACLRDNLR
jgi:hypothetical protein